MNSARAADEAYFKESRAWVARDTGGMRTVYVDF
jgi:hypothetical protein